MEYVYNNLRQAKDQNASFMQSAKTVFMLTEESVRGYLRQSPFVTSCGDASKAILYAQNEFDQHLLNVQSKTSLTANLWYPKDEVMLSKSQKKWLSLLNNAIDDNGDDYRKIFMAFEKIRTDVLKNGTKEEQIIAITAIEMGKSSLEYWYNNGNEWAGLMNIPTKGWFSWKNVGRSDIQGAISSALTIGIAALISGPPGWVAGTVGILGGAAASSAVEAGTQVVERYL
jgi:hypothetical protein